MNMKASGIFKLSTLALLTTAAMGAQAGISADTAQGTFAISGDVEFNNDYQKTEATASDSKMIDQSGRLLGGVSGVRDASQDRYISANAQILLNMDGSITADDAWIAMGKQADWEVKLGRFEAYNLFPAGQDTVLNHASGVNVYTTSYARGRSGNGQINLSKTAGSTYFEVSTNFMSAGAADTNAVFLRPVVSVGLGDAFRLAAGAEINATADDADAANDFTGYGATLNYSADMLSVNVNFATRDYDVTGTQTETSMGINAQYGNAFIGYVNAVNDNGGATDPEVNTFYASYKFANIMDVEDLALYLGASTSEVKDSDNADTSVRLRVKYLF
jgi:hypothetical protein